MPSPAATKILGACRPVTSSDPIPASPVSGKAVCSGNTGTPAAGPNAAIRSCRLEGLGPAVGVPVFPLQTAYPDTGDAGIGSEDVTGLHAPKILVAAGDGISETSYGWLWNFLARELNAPFTPVPLRAIGRMDDLQTFNVLIIPDGSGSRMRRELGDDGVAKLKA